MRYEPGSSIGREFQARVRPVRGRVKELLGAGSRSTHRKTRRACANILKVEPSLWTFVRMEGVEPTNNVAERGLRRAVLWRKKSFGTPQRSRQPVRREDSDGGSEPKAAGA